MGMRIGRKQVGATRARGRRVQGAGGAARLVVATLALAGAPGAVAQDLVQYPGRPAGDAVQVAQAPATVRLAIPAQPLRSALVLYSAATGIDVVFDGSVGSDVRSPGVSGTVTAEEGLRRLLAGTGYRYRLSGSTATLLPAGPGAADGAVRLDTVAVEGRRSETALGPVAGYVATRSTTGTKTDTPLLATPQSISVVTRDQMEAQAAPGVSQALRYTAGVLTESNGADIRYNTVAARGFSLSGQEYLDGLKLITGSFALPSFDTWQFERVEVLKGPSSVLYGQAAPGGIINQISRRPPERAGGEAQLQLGNFGRVQGAFDVGGALDRDGKLLYRLTGLARETDLQVDHVTEQRIAIAPAFAWRPDADTSLTFLGGYQYTPSGGLFNQLPAQGTLLANPNGQFSTRFYNGEPGYDRFERTQIHAGYEAEHRIDEVWTIRQNLRAMRSAVDYDLVYGTGLQADLRTLNRTAQAVRESVDSLVVDNQVQARFSTGPLSHTLLGGLDHQRVHWDYRFGSGAAPPIDFLNPVYNQPIVRPAFTASQTQERRQTGLYAQDQLRLGGWALTLGVRQDWAELDTKNRVTGVTTKQKDDAFTGRAGLGYVFDFGLAPYVSYAESFQPATGTTYAGRPFEPTRSRQYEAGVKYQPRGLDAFVTLAAFDLTQTNVATPDPDHTGFSIQAGEVRARGIEIEGKATVAPGLDLVASYTYLDAEVTRDNSGLQGKTPAGVPRHMASAWADYTVPDGPLAGFGVGGGVRYIGANYNTNNSLRVPSVTLADAAVHYDLSNLRADLEGWRIALNVSNLFDKEYVGRCFGSACYYGLRRTVLANVTYKW
ncbi:ligand-gated channel [Allostella vacuolata]|nr:ligand-gated channel [Stella vacuolata]